MCLVMSPSRAVTPAFIPVNTNHPARSLKPTVFTGVGVSSASSKASAMAPECP